MHYHCIHNAYTRSVIGKLQLLCFVIFSPLQCFPDRFVRREIETMIVGCPHQQKGCPWEDKVTMLDAHLKTCNFLSEECKQCGLVLTSDLIGSHAQECSKAEMKCPLAEFGCQHTRTVSL